MLFVVHNNLVINFQCCWSSCIISIWM